MMKLKIMPDVVNAVEHKLVEFVRPHPSSSSVKSLENIPLEIAKVVWLEVSLVRTSTVALTARYTIVYSVKMSADT